MSISLDPNQAQHFVQPDLGPNCLQMLSANNIGKQRVKVGIVFRKLNGVCWLKCHFFSSLDGQLIFCFAINILIQGHMFIYEP